MSDRNIQVSGQNNFSGIQWKEAFLHYLQGMASGEESVTYRPKIRISDNMGNQSLTFGLYNYSEKNTLSWYWAEGSTMDGPTLFGDFHEQTVTVDCQQAEAEWGMTRFVHNDQVKCLRIRLGSCRNLVFWKKPDGELGIVIDYKEENF